MYEHGGLHGQDLVRLGEPGPAMSLLAALAQKLLALHAPSHGHLNLAILLTRRANPGLKLGSLLGVLFDLLDRYVRLPVVGPEGLPELSVDPELTEAPPVPVPAHMLSQTLHGRHSAGADLADEHFAAIVLILYAIIGGKNAVFKFSLKFDEINRR